MLILPCTLVPDRQDVKESWMGALLLFQYPHRYISSTRFSELEAFRGIRAGPVTDMIPTGGKGRDHPT